MQILFFTFDVPANSNGDTLRKINLTPASAKIRRRLLGFSIDQQTAYARYEIRVDRDLRWSTEKSDVTDPLYRFFPIDIIIEPGEVAELEIIGSFDFALDVEDQAFQMYIADELVQ